MRILGYPFATQAGLLFWPKVRIYANHRADSRVDSEKLHINTMGSFEAFDSRCSSLFVLVFVLVLVLVPFSQGPRVLG